MEPHGQRYRGGLQDRDSQMTAVRVEGGALRVGIIGTGWVATQRHIPVFKKDRRVSVQAVMDPDLTKAASVAERFGIPESYSVSEELLAKSLDIISICAPPQAHASLIEDALRAGSNVFVEKPMTMSVSEGKFLESLASEKKLVLCPSHNFLFARSMERIKGLMAKGTFGEVRWALGIQTSSWRRRLPTWYQDLPAGLFFDEAPHLLYLMQYFLGDLQIDNSWRETLIPGDAVQDRIEVRVRGEHAGGHLSVWFGAPTSEWLLVVFCKNGTLIVDLFRDLLVHLPLERNHGPRDVVGSVLRASLQAWGGIAASGARYLRGRQFYGHDLLVERLIDSLISGSDPPISAREGWKVVGLIEDIIVGSDRCDEKK